MEFSLHNWLHKQANPTEYISLCLSIRGLPRGLSGKKPAWRCRRHRRCGFDPWVRKTPWRRKQQATPVFSPRKSHGQRDLVVYGLWGSQRIGHDSGTRTLSMHLTICILLVLFLWRTLITIPYLIWIGKILLTSQAFSPVESHYSQRTSASPVSIFFTWQSIPKASLNVGSFKPWPSHIFSPSVSNVLRQLTFCMMKGLQFLFRNCLFLPT